MKKNLDTKVRPQRDAIVSAIAVLLVACACNLLVYHYASKGLLDEVRNSILSVARTAAAMTDGDLHETLQEPSDTLSENYLKIRDNYDKILSANKDIVYIYTNKLVDDKIVFVIDSQTKEISKLEENRPEDGPAYIMDEYNDASDMMKEALKTHEARAEDQPYSDKWGTFISGYAPIKNSKDEFVGVVGADMNASEFMARMQSVTYALYLGIALALGLSAVTYVSVFRIRSDDEEALEKRLHKQGLMEEFNQYIQVVVKDVSYISEEFKNKTNDITQLASTSSEESKWALGSIQDSASMFNSVLQSTSELTSAVDIIGREVAKCSKTAIEAHSKSSQVDTASNNLIEVSGKITGVVDVISDIAERINLLALNAKIEAHAAGDAGRGFAVVANEIKALATQTMEATNEISTYINAVYKATGETAFAFNGVTQIITSIKDITDNLNQVVSQQEAVVKDIAVRIHDVTSKTRGIVHHVESVTDIASQIQDSTDKMQSTVINLSAQSDDLNKEVESFLGKIKS